MDLKILTIFLSKIPDPVVLIVKSISDIKFINL